MDPFSVAIEIVPLAGERLKKFLARNEVKNLYRLVQADVRAAQLPPGSVDHVVAKIDELRVDPTVAGALLALLDRGESRLKDPLRRRLIELLTFDDARLNSDEIADLVLRAIEANLAPAKRDDRSAQHLDALITQDALRELPDQVAEAMAERSGTSAPLTPLRIVRALAELSPSQTRALDELGTEDPDGQARLQAALAAGGIERIAALVDNPQDWFAAGSAALWATAGRLLQSVADMPHAQIAYERAAENPGVRDRARQLIRASNVAAIQGDTARAGELAATARAEAPDDPAVLLHEARELTDPEATVELLDQVEPVDDDQRTLLELIRAGALLNCGKLDEAREAIERARGCDAEGHGTDELSAIADLVEAEQALARNSEPAIEALVHAAETFTSLTKLAQNQGDWAGAGVHLGRAINAYALAGDSARGVSLLDQALADERLHSAEDVRRVLARGALLLRRFETVLSLIPEDGDSRDRLERAAARVIGGTAEDRTGAFEDLRELFSTGEELKKEAAFLMLCAATNDPSIPWDEEAEETIGGDRPLTVAVLRAERLAKEGDMAGAEAVLRPHSDDPNALRLLVHLNEQQDRTDTAIRLAETLVDKTGSAQDHLMLAGLLVRAGRRDAAVDRLLRTARDPNASADESSTAYARAANLLVDDAKLAEVERLARDWASAREDGSDPRWLVVLSLAMRFEHAQAWGAWQDLGEPDADTEPRALLLAEVAGFAAEPLAAVQLIADLSDRFGRPEDLEAHLILTILRLGDRASGAPADLGNRIRETFTTFFTRFPNSTRVQSIQIDLENPVASLLDALGPQLEARAEQTEQLARGVRAGTTAVPLLAAAAGRSCGETLMALPALPLAYPDDQLDRLDRADAAAALDAKGAIWDPFSIFTVAALGGTAESGIRSSLPASRVARATQQDTARDPLGTPEGRRATLSLVHGLPYLAEWSEADQRADETRARRMMEFANGLAVGSMGESGDELTELATSDHPLPIRLWAATLAVARHHELPVYSDDRAVRQSARSMGLRAFGTPALLDVLVERGVLSQTDRDRARNRLLSHGAWGLRHSTPELVELATRANWQPTQGLRAAFTDVSAWVSLRAGWAERIVGFLEAVAEAAPDQMDAWTHRAVDAVTEVLGNNYEANARLLLFLALNPFIEPIRMSDDGVQALLASLRRIPYFRYFRPSEDLLVAAVATMLTPLGDDRQLQAAALVRIVERVSPEDKALLMARFVR
jgi:tetratricopeptide (TPR) repeat protein